MTNAAEYPTPSPRPLNSRRFLRDAVLFQGKLLVDGVRDLVLMPVAIGAAVVDVLKPADQPGRRFYDVMHYGKQTEQWIGLFEAAERAPAEDRARPHIDVPNLDSIVDGVGEKLGAGRFYPR